MDLVGIRRRLAFLALMRRRHARLAGRLCGHFAGHDSGLLRTDNACPTTSLIYKGRAGCRMCCSRVKNRSKPSKGGNLPMQQLGFNPPDSFCARKCCLAMNCWIP
jgi:hypothetical protein